MKKISLTKLPDENTVGLALCRTDYVREGQARGLPFKDHGLIVVREDGHYFVYLNKCPHLSIPLEWIPDQFKDSEDMFLKCATHGALFLIETGECIAGPCRGAYLQAVPFYIKEEWLFITD